MQNNIDKLANALNGLGDIDKQEEGSIPQEFERDYKVVFFQFPKSYFDFIKSKTEEKKLNDNSYTNSNFINDSINSFKRKLATNKINLHQRPKGFRPTAKGRKTDGEQGIELVKSSFCVSNENHNFMYDYMYHKIQEGELGYTKAKFLIEILNHTK